MNKVLKKIQNITIDLMNERTDILTKKNEVVGFVEEARLTSENKKANVSCFNNVVGSLLKQCKLILGLTQADLGAMIHRGVAHYGQYESGAVGLKAYELYLLYYALGLTDLNSITIPPKPPVDILRSREEVLSIINESQSNKKTRDHFEKSFYYHIGLLLRSYRESLGLTQSVLGRLINKTGMQYSTMERGIIAFRAYELFLVCAALGISDPFCIFKDNAEDIKK